MTDKNNLLCPVTFLGENRNVIAGNCSQYLESRPTVPLIKSIPNEFATDLFLKIKLRHKSPTEFDAIFNKALGKQKFKERTVSVNSSDSTQYGHQDFFILPPNGFNFLYSRNIKRSDELHLSVYNNLKDKCDEEMQISLFSDILRYNYKSDNLQEAAEAGVEVLIHGVQFVYAFNANAFNFDQLIQELQSIDSII